MANELVVVQSFDSGGNIVPNAKFYSYVPGTTTPQAVFSDPELTVPLANPVQCDGAGRATFYFDADKNYKFLLKDADDAEQLWLTVQDYTPREDNILYLITAETVAAATQAEAAQAAAEEAQTSAEAAQASAETAQTAAISAQTNASASATSAANSASSAGASAAAASASQTAAAASETDAETAASSASTSAASAASAQTASEAAQAAAEAAETDAEGAADLAGVIETELSAYRIGVVADETAFLAAAAGKEDGAFGVNEALSALGVLYNSGASVAYAAALTGEQLTNIGEIPTISAAVDDLEALPVLGTYSYPEDYGAVGDSTDGTDGTDDTTALKQWAAGLSGKIGILPAGKRYRMTGSNSLTFPAAGNFQIIGLGGIIDASSIREFRALCVINGTQDAEKTISGSSTIDVTLGTIDDSDTYGLEGAHQFTVTGHGYEAGDQVLMSSDDLYDVNHYSVEGAAFEHRGQLMTVIDVIDADTFRTAEALAQALITNPVVAKINPCENFRIQGMHLIGSGRLLAGSEGLNGAGLSGISMNYCRNAVIVQNKVFHCDYNAIRGNDCSSILVQKNITTHDKKDKGDTNGSIQYHIAFNDSGDGIVIDGNKMTGGSAGVNFSRSIDPGVTRNIMVINNTASGVRGHALDCHGENDLIIIMGNIADGCGAGFDIAMPYMIAIGNTARDIDRSAFAIQQTPRVLIIAKNIVERAFNGVKLGPRISSASITAFADAGGGKTTVTVDASTFVDLYEIGLPPTVDIGGTTNYNGTFAVSNPTGSTFEIDTAYVADDATGTADQSSLNPLSANDWKIMGNQFKGIEQVGIDLVWTGYGYIDRVDVSENTIEALGNYAVRMLGRFRGFGVDNNRLTRPTAGGAQAILIDGYGDNGDGRFPEDISCERNKYSTNFTAPFVTSNYAGSLVFRDNIPLGVDYKPVSPLFLSASIADDGVHDFYLGHTVGLLEVIGDFAVLNGTYKFKSGATPIARLSATNISTFANNTTLNAGATGGTDGNFNLTLNTTTKMLRVKNRFGTTQTFEAIWTGR